MSPRRAYSVFYVCEYILSTPGEYITESASDARGKPAALVVAWLVVFAFVFYLRRLLDAAHAERILQIAGEAEGDELRRLEQLPGLKGNAQVDVLSQQLLWNINENTLRTCKLHMQSFHLRSYNTKSGPDAL